MPKTLLPSCGSRCTRTTKEDLDGVPERSVTMANNTFDVGLKDICDRLKIWRPSVDEEDEGGFHPLMALATKHLVEE